MLTKAIIKSINPTGTRCTVEMPLFKSASSTTPIEAEALINTVPGVFNGFSVGDVVFISFEENALEKPIILGKLFRGANIEGTIRGGGGVFNSLKVSNDAVIPSSTIFIFPTSIKDEYKDFKTPKKIADYIKWLESFTKSNLNQLEDHFRCFKNWTQWQLQAENVEIDDGDLDEQISIEPFKYQNEGTNCRLCEVCTKENIRRYLKLPTDNTYPKI